MKYLVFIAIGCSSLWANAQENRFGSIASMGKVSTVPGVSLKADPSLTYKIAIDIANSDTASDKMSDGFELVARLINLLALDSVAPQNRKIAVVLHNLGSYSTQNDASYQQRFGRPNPNRTAIETLAKAGVEFYVCGQSVLKRNIQPNQLLPQVQMATSYLTAFATFQLEGYATFKF